MNAPTPLPGLDTKAAAPGRRPRLGFLGAGWIGRHRLRAIAADGQAQVVAVADASADALRELRDELPGAAMLATLDDLLDQDLDGLVIATPSALHAAQSLRAIERGLAVFCQKPLARDARESRAVIEAARRADRLLGVDLSYRHTRAAQCLRERLRAGDIGEVFAIDLVFHNAYGPDKAWFRDPALSGGGCLIDLGIHLLDLALWALDPPTVSAARGQLWHQGRRLGADPGEVEDHALAQFEIAGGALARLACSWNLSAGQDAVIEAVFHGTRGSLAMRNLNGSFYDFAAERCEGTRRERLVEPPDDWGGRAAVAWARQLAADGRFDPAVESVARVAALLDAVYGREAA